MSSILGYIGLCLTAYCIICGMLSRVANNNEGARANGIEAAIWFVAACVCFRG